MASAVSPVIATAFSFNTFLKKVLTSKARENGRDIDPCRLMQLWRQALSFHDASLAHEELHPNSRKFHTKRLCKVRTGEFQSTQATVKLPCDPCPSSVFFLYIKSRSPPSHCPHCSSHFHLRSPSHPGTSPPRHFPITSTVLQNFK